MRSDVVRKVILNVRVQPGMPMNLRNERYIEFYAAETPQPQAASANSSTEPSPSVLPGGLSKFLIKLKNGPVTESFRDSLAEIIPPLPKDKDLKPQVNDSPKKTAK